MKDFNGNDHRGRGDHIASAMRFLQTHAAATAVAPRLLTLSSSPDELLRSLEAELRVGSAAWLRADGLDVESDRHARATRLLSRLASSRPRADERSRRSRRQRGGVASANTASNIACETVVLDWRGVRNPTAEALAMVPLIGHQLQRLGTRVICCAPENARTFAALSASGGIVALGNAAWVWDGRGDSLADTATGMRLIRGAALPDIGPAGRPWWWERAMNGPIYEDEQLELFNPAGLRRAKRLLERALRGGELVIPAPTVVFGGDLKQGALDSFLRGVQDTLALFGAREQLRGLTESTLVELVSNIQRHSEAKRASALVIIRNAERPTMEIAVVDDGVGIPAAALRAGHVEPIHGDEDKLCVSSVLTGACRLQRTAASEEGGGSSSERRDLDPTTSGWGMVSTLHRLVIEGGANAVVRSGRARAELFPTQDVRGALTPWAIPSGWGTQIRLRIPLK